VRTRVTPLSHGTHRRSRGNCFSSPNMGALNILLGYYIGRGIAVLGASFSVGGNRPTDWG
jgi:hypothetical protein